jgi:CheY-like chemotaxis protein
MTALGLVDSTRRHPTCDKRGISSLRVSRGGLYRGCELMAHSILVVDDDRAIAAVLADLLIEEGYAGRYVCSGHDALTQIAQERPELVLSDVSMPEIDGLTLIRRLRERGDQTPVVLMSGVYAEIDLPGVQFLPKPFDFQDLLRVVEQLVDGQVS